MSSEHSRVEGSEGLVVEPEDDVGTLPALAPGVGDDPAREVGRAPLQHLDTPGGRWNMIRWTQDLHCVTIFLFRR